MVRLKDL
jgi:hypothetical protein